MFVHSNIRYLRKFKKISQESFAEKLGLNRGNIASYELSTTPPMDVLMNISEWFNVSLDALLKEDLSENLTFQAVSGDKKVSEKEIILRLKELIRFLNIEESELAKKIGWSKLRLLELFETKKGIDFPLIVKLSKVYPWLSMDWLLKGNGSMAGTSIPPQKGLSVVAEAPKNQYEKGNEFPHLFGKFMGQVLERLDKLEKKK